MFYDWICSSVPQEEIHSSYYEPNQKPITGENIGHKRQLTTDVYTDMSQTAF